MGSRQSTSSQSCRDYLRRFDDHAAIGRRMPRHHSVEFQPSLQDDAVAFLGSGSKFRTPYLARLGPPRASKHSGEKAFRVLLLQKQKQPRPPSSSSTTTATSCSSRGRRRPLSRYSTASGVVLPRVPQHPQNSSALSLRPRSSTSSLDSYLPTRKTGTYLHPHMVVPTNSLDF